MTDFQQKYLAVYRSWRRTLEILEPFRTTLVNIRRDLADEGDRVYFGSSNDADQFKDIADTLDDITMEEAIYPAHKDASDLYQELRDAKADASRLHTEKMAMFDKLVETRTGLHELTKAYVNLLEVGRDRITSLGGTCDSVEQMETGDPALIAAKTLLQPLTEIERIL